jgi:hypothetical protein
MSGMPESAGIDVLILANHAEAINGLLYIMGGGWTDAHRQIVKDNPPPTTHFGIGVSVRVPWHDTNRPHKLQIVVEEADAMAIIAKVEGELNVGRPPQLPPGSLQHAVMAINIDTVFPAAGEYRVVARIDETLDQATWPFRIHDTIVRAAAPE